MHILSKIVHFTPLSVFVQPQTQTWIKEADEKKNAKIQDIFSKEAKTTAASLGFCVCVFVCVGVCGGGGGL